MKDILQIGTKIAVFYGNGAFKGYAEVKKLSEKSVWIGRSRESWNTVAEMFRLGLYRFI